MTELTAQQRQEMEAAVLEAFRSLDSTSEAVRGIDPKKLFCEHWDKAKKLLTYIKDRPGTPALVKVAIGIIIAAGDAAYPGLCPR